ncbi:MAG: transposase family protein [Thermoguttaceae bacterium]
MSTSLLYHAFGVRGYRYVRTEYREGGVVIDQDPSEWRCAACGSRDVQPKGRVRREFRTVPIGRKPVTVAFPVPPRRTA